jgi:LacI family transcriptional regulator
MTERGLGAPVVWPCADNKLTGLEATLLLRKAHSEVAALVCNGDMVATEACLALQLQGLTPSRYMSVIGSYDIADAAVANDDGCVPASTGAAAGASSARPEQEP